MNKVQTVPLAFGCQFCTLLEPLKDEQDRLLVATNVAWLGGRMSEGPILSNLVFYRFCGLVSSLHVITTRTFN